MRNPTTTSTRLTRALLTLGLTAGLTTGLASTAAHAEAGTPGAQHFYVPEEWDGTEHTSADENTCGPWAATLHEIRHGGYTVLLPPGGQSSGEAHINGSVDGWIQLTPDDPTLPTYTGSYREKVDGVLADPDNDTFRVLHFQLRDRLTGSDGSTLVLVLSSKVTVTANGHTVVERSVAACE